MPIPRHLDYFQDPRAGKLNDHVDILEKYRRETMRPPEEPEFQRQFPEFGVCTAVTGNEATLEPCHSWDDTTRTNYPPVKCFIVWPPNSTPSPALRIIVGEIYGYWPLPQGTHESAAVQRGTLWPVNFGTGCE